MEQVDKKQEQYTMSDYILGFFFLLIILAMIGKFINGITGIFGV